MKKFILFSAVLTGYCSDIFSTEMTKFSGNPPAYSQVAQDLEQQFDGLLERYNKYPNYINREPKLLDPARQLIKAGLERDAQWAVKRVEKHSDLLLWPNDQPLTRSEILQKIQWLPARLPDALAEKLSNMRGEIIMFWVAVYGNSKNITAPPSPEKLKEMFDDGGLNQEIEEHKEPLTAKWYLSLSSENPPKDNEVPDYIQKSSQINRWNVMTKLAALWTADVKNKDACKNIGNILWMSLYQERFPDIFKQLLKKFITGDAYSIYDSPNQFYRPHSKNIQKLIADMPKGFADDLEMQQKLFDARVKNLQWWTTTVDRNWTDKQFDDACNQAGNGKIWVTYKNRDKAAEYKIMFYQEGLVQELDALLEQAPDDITLLEIKLSLSEKGELIAAPQEEIDALKQRIAVLKKQSASSAQASSSSFLYSVFGKVFLRS